jgi:hypothetical protein
LEEGYSREQLSTRSRAQKPRDAVEALAQLLFAAEALGDFAQDARLVIAPLITEKRRPIGLYLALVRA